MAEKQISPKAPEKAEERTSKTAAARVSKKTVKHKKLTSMKKVSK